MNRESAGEIAFRYGPTEVVIAEERPVLAHAIR